MLESTKKRRKTTLSALALLLFATSGAFATTGADYVELTPAEMKSRQFQLSIRKDEEDTMIELLFPKSVFVGKFSLAPDSTKVAVISPGGKVIAVTNSATGDSEFRYVITYYKPKLSDLSVSVTYTCSRADAANFCNTTIFGIDSVSKLIKDHPEVANLRSCRRVEGAPLEILDCT